MTCGRCGWLITDETYAERGFVIVDVGTPMPLDVRKAKGEKRDKKGR